MKTVVLIGGLLLILGVAVMGYESGSGDGKKVLLRDVHAITLHRGARTAARRVSPIDQLHCTSSPDSQLEPDTVQCVNVGLGDDGEPQWKCEADLDKSVQFDQLQVSCEGYDYPDDPYILSGSCGLTYSLKRTPGYRSTGSYQQQHQPYTQQQQQQHPGAWDEHAKNQFGSHYTSSGGFFKSLFKIGLWAFIVFVILRWCGCFGGHHPRHAVPPPAAGADGWREIGPHPPPPPYGGPGGAPPPYGAGYGPHSAPPPPPSSGGGWTPGFWSGMMGGMMLNRFFGPRTNTAPHFGGTWGSSWGGNTAGNTFRSSGGFSAPSTSSSSTTRTSSGYSSTSRR